MGTGEATAWPLSRSGKSPGEVALQAAKAAGQALVRLFPRQKQVRYKGKGRGNLVTDVDTLVEEQVLSLLKKEYPDFGYLAEESAGTLHEESYTWILDPLDGTRNYALGIPFFAVSLALAHHKEVVLGITYNPMTNELFQAHKGQGAFLNGKRIWVSTRKELKTSTLGLDLGYLSDKGLKALQQVTSLWPGIESLRILGSATLGLAYAAAGRLDLYFHQNLAIWDIAASLLLVREAGGVITDYQGNPATLESTSAIASNPALHAQFLNTLSE